MRPDLEDLPSFAFGDGPALANRLAALVVAGRKTGTCWSAKEGEKNVRPGARWIVLNGEGCAVCLLETVALETFRFHEATPLHARKEGEGDLSLAYWQRAHEDYFRKNGGFTPDMPLYYETFRLVETLDQAFVETAPLQLAAEIAEAAQAGFVMPASLI